MGSAYIGPIKELRELFQSSRPSEIIIPRYQQLYGSPAQSQIDAWDESLPILLNSLQDSIFNQVFVILELQMPIGGERADCVLLGGTKESPKALIIELKQWTNTDLDPSTGEVRVPGLGIHTHPSLQALNYRGKLKFFSTVAQNYDLYACVFMHNANESDRSQISSQEIAKDWVAESPVFINPKELAEYVKEKLIPAELSKEQADEFANSPFAQSQHLFDFIDKYADAISSDIEDKLAETGMGLTDEQRVIKNLVKKLLANPGEKGVDVIVNGRPGSGKTLLAVSILMMAFKQGKSCLFALRNNRLQAVLKQIFDSVTPGLSGFMVYFEPRNGTGIAQFNGHVDILICDEAQRMKKRTIPNALSKADISVIFLDESQRLNPPEEGTVANFVDTSKALGRRSHVMQLPGLIRCTGGQNYSDWVELLLETPSDVNGLCNLARHWMPLYELSVAESITDFLSELQRKRNKGKVALVASFTESPGVLNNPSHPDNLRVGFPLTSGFSLYKGIDIRIPWLMSTSEYKKFWIRGECNQLSRVASIYGCQGFESDYVGVIWGRDLLYRNGKWILGNPNHCYDTIDKLVIGRIPTKRWSENALSLILNRYRIFLTRGIKGTVLFCEDEETRKYFLGLASRFQAYIA